MQAIQISNPATLDTMRVVHLPNAPAPGRGEIQVRLRASSLNYHDYAVVTGAIPVPAGRIPLSDGAGEIIALGEDVTQFAVGDLVVSTFFPDWANGGPQDGGFTNVPGDGMDGYAREVVTGPANWFTPAPRGYDAMEAATLTCAGLTAWRALVVEGAIKAGDSVLVQGTGGVSIFALQFAKAMGATVIATSSSDEKLERLKAMGADHIINYRGDTKWGATAKKLTGGRGVDHVVEIGGAGTLPQSLAAIRVGGHISMIGVLAGFQGTVPTAMLMGKQARVIGVTVGSRRHQLDMIAAIDATGIRPVVETRFALADLADAFRHQESGLHFGKIGIEI